MSLIVFLFTLAKTFRTILNSRGDSRYLHFVLDHSGNGYSVFPFSKALTTGVRYIYVFIVFRPCPSIPILSIFKNQERLLKFVKIFLASTVI